MKKWLNQKRKNEIVSTTNEYFFALHVNEILRR